MKKKSKPVVKSAKKATKKKFAPKSGKKAAQKVAKRTKKAKMQTKKVVTTTTVTTTTTMSNPKETHYLLILDESTSMDKVRGETLIGMNEQIKTIKNLDKKYPDQDYFVSIVKFSTSVNTLVENVPASKIEEFSENGYVPNGWTALHDAIGMGVTNLKNKIQSKLNSGEASALVVIITDGEENQSKEFNAEKIKTLITDLEKTGMWTFTFIGANQDAVLTAKSLGVNLNNTVNYSASNQGTKIAFASINSAMNKRAAYTNAGLYEATTMSFMSDVTRGSNDIGEDASLLDLSGNITAEDIQKAKDSIKNQKTTTNN